MTLAEQMLTDALAAQKFTRKHFVTELDFTEQSVQELETQFDAVRYALRGGLTDDNINNLTKLWGAYLGETLKRLGGGEWTTIQTDSRERLAVQGRETTIFPHEKIHARLINGASENVWDFFQAMKPRLGGGGE
jgi:hypothetical protein